MAGGSRRQSGNEMPPERVQNAVRNMNAFSSSGMQRGYVPQNTGERRAVNPSRGSGNGGGFVPHAVPGNGNYTPGANGGQRGYVVPGDGNGNGGKKKGKAGIILAAVLVLAVIAGIAVYGAGELQKKNVFEEKQRAVTQYDGLFCPGVYVDGIDLGGMTPEQAMNSVQSQIRQRNDAWQVTLVYEGNVVATIDASMLGMATDPAVALNEAWLQGHTGTVEERYEAMNRLAAEPYYGFTAQPSGNNSVIDRMMAEIKARIDRPATDAKLLAFDTSLEYPFVFQDEEYGLNLNTAPLISRLYQMVSSMESGTVEIVPDRIEPAVKKVDLQKHYMHLSTAKTPIDRHSPENRNSNIRRAFEFINGYKLEPGKTFSFNSVVGERTVENGFLTAIEYVYGEHTEGIGGGVCQASTTVYQAAVCAGLQITDRSPHSDSVSYTEYGKDATVYWYNGKGGKKVDLKFKNTSGYPIYIVAKVTQDPSNKQRLIATVSMYGEDMGDVRYELVTEEIETLPPPFEPEYIKDKKGEYVTYTDQEKSVSKPKEGHVVKSYRVRYEANRQTGREELFTDTYKPQAEKIYVGVKKRE